MRADNPRLGVYRLGAELGRGGMGTVYQAVSEAAGPAGPAGTTVAIKVIHPHLAGNERHFERFRREAAIGCQIAHPNIVRTYDTGVEELEGEAHHYMVMEFVQGQTLAGLLQELGTVPEDLCYQIADQVLEALQVIHDHGVVHRDIKPENIVITPDHRVLLMDLGVARIEAAGHTLTEAGEFVGSLAYAAPEQFFVKDARIGPATDLYAFGLVLYALHTGDSPFAGTELQSLIQQKLQSELVRPRLLHADLDAFWDEVIATATRKNAAERFASAAEMQRVLREGEAGEWWLGRGERIGQSITARALKRLQLAREAPLVGRAFDLKRLLGVWERARTSGGTLLLGGHSGVGKSRVLYDFLERVAGGGGASVAAGRCVGSTGRSFQPFVEALSDLLLPLDADPAARRAALVERLAALLPDTPAIVPQLADFLLGGLQSEGEETLSHGTLFAACTRLVQRLAAELPLILVVEDLHLAGAETLELYRYVARAVPEHAVLLVGVYCDEDVEDGTPLHALVAQPDADGARRVVLGPLEAPATEQLVRAVVGVEHTARSLARPLHERSDGTAFLVLEMLARLQADVALVARDGQGLVLARPVAQLQVPSTVRDVVNLKLAQLDDEQRETLEAAAVIGHEFDASLLGEVLEQKRIHLLKRLAVLERKHRLVVTRGKGSFRFAGHHVFQAVYDVTSPDLREAYHGLVADTILEGLEDAQPDAPTSFSLLSHLFHADRATEAEPYLEAALRHLGAAFHASFAVPFLEQIATAFQDAAPEKRVAIALKQWTFYDLLASRGDQMRVLDVAHDLAESLGDLGVRAQVHALRAGSWWYAGDYAKASEEARAGLALAREAGNRKWEAACHHTLGAVAFRRGDLAACATEMREALAIRRDIGDRRGEASTLQALALVMPGIGEDDAVLPTMEEALRIWREVGERRGEAAVQMNIGVRLVDRARCEEGLAHLEVALANHRETGALLSEAMALMNMGRAYQLLDRCDEARSTWSHALELFTDLGDPNGEMAVRTMLGSALVTGSMYPEARRQLDAAIDLAERKGARLKLVAALCEMGRLLTETGNPSGARQPLERAHRIARESGNPVSLVATLSGLASAALGEGDAEGALVYLEEALPVARQGAPASAALALARYARALQGVGRGEEALQIAREAQERIRIAGAVPPAQGAELYQTLAELLGEQECCQEILARVRALEDAAAAATTPDATVQFVPGRKPPDGPDANATVQFFPKRSEPDEEN